MLENLSKLVSHPLVILQWNGALNDYCEQLRQQGHKVASINRPLDPELFNHLARFDMAIWSIKDLNRHLLNSFAEFYPIALLEGVDTKSIRSFYWDTWSYNNVTLATNIMPGIRFKPIKKQNLVKGRGIFLKETYETRSVIKRETKDFKHSWVYTNLSHEIEMYKMLKDSPFFPKIIKIASSNIENWLEMEYCERHGNYVPERKIKEFFDFLKSNQLFIIDFMTDSFIPTKLGLKAVDLESVFVLPEVTPENILKFSRKLPPKPDYQSQYNHLIKRLSSDIPPIRLL